MSELENIDDELLSAYLDNELPPEERARVEARLATDPATRQLLEQLRTMSQAVHGLPRVSLGAGFRDSVIRRAEQAARTAKLAASSTRPSDAPSNGAATPLRSAGSSLTFGRSRRGWFWAAMAVAAGLFVMVFQPESEQSQESGPVAIRRNESASDDAKLAVDALKSRSATPDSATAPPPASGTPGPVAGWDQPAQASRANGDSAASASGEVGFAYNSDAIDKSTSPSPESRGALDLKTSTGEVDRFATTEGAPTITDLRAAASRPASDFSGKEVMNAPGNAGMSENGNLPDDDPLGALARSELPTPTDDAQLVVVRVLAKPEALQNKTFDKILGTNGIKVIGPTDEESERLAAQEERPAATRQDLADQEKKPEERSSDVILVEAPKDAIFSCMSSLDKDVQNFPGVAVDEPPAVQDDFKSQDTMLDESTAATDAAPAKPLPEEKLEKELGWQRYNRGQIPRDEDALTRGRGFYYNSSGDPPADRASGTGPAGFGGGVRRSAGDERASEFGHLFRKDSYAADGPRARRVLPEEMSQRQYRPLAEESRRGGVASDDASKVVGIKLKSAEGELKTDASKTADQLQVLFILSCSDDTTEAATPATSPAAADWAK